MTVRVIAAGSATTTDPKLDIHSRSTILGARRVRPLTQCKQEALLPLKRQPDHPLADSLLRDQENKILRHLEH